jgi:hypothetical protein
MTYVGDSSTHGSTLIPVRAAAVQWGFPSLPTASLET